MELKTFLKILKAYLVNILILASFGGVLGYYSSKISAESFQIEKTYFVRMPSSDAANQIENLLIQNQASSQTDTAVALLESADFQGEALSVGSSLSVRKLAPQVVRLTITNSSQDNLLKDFQNLPQNFSLKTQKLNQNNLNLVSVSENNKIQQPNVNTKITTGVGFLLGLLSALLLIGLKLYLKI